MKNIIKLSLAMVPLLVSGITLSAQAPEHGSFNKNGSEQVWHNEQNKWLTPEQFWRDFTDNNGGLTWSQSREYPQYSQVKEHDTFLVELDSGICLMEFFHSRWRRANDVRRWDDKFNQYSGCAKVFE